MSASSPTARACLTSDRTVGGEPCNRALMFWCPGCDLPHGPHVGARNEPGPIWEWNGDVELPTLSPSIRVSGKRIPKGDAATEPWPDFVCHSFVRAGRIEFLGDCTHALAGQTVDLPPWEMAHKRPAP